MRRIVPTYAAGICALTLLLAAAGCSSGSGNSTPPPPPPAAPTVTVSASPTEVASGASSTLSITSTNASSCAMSNGNGVSQSVTCNGSVTVSPSVNTTYTVTTTGAGGSATASAAVMVQLAISLSAPSSTTVDVNGTTNLAWSVTGGDGQASVALTANPAVGSFSPATETQTAGTQSTWTAPSSVTTSPTTVTVTATVTDGTGSTAQTASANVSVTVIRVITISVDPQYPIPNDEYYADFGVMFGTALECTGCVAGDTLNTQSTYGGDTTTTFTQGFLNPWEELINFIGPGYVPGLVSHWITGTDGAKSNTLWLTFDGAQNEAVQDPSSGEVYYYDSGNGAVGSGEIMKYQPDGTADGSYTNGTASGDENIAFDGQLIWLTQPGSPTSSEVVSFNAGTGAYGGSYFATTNGEPEAISANSGLVCVTIPTGGTSPNGTDAVDCNDGSGTFTLPGIPAGSEPTAVLVADASHVIVYGRGDQTLQWYTVSGTTATAAGTLQLSAFTATDANYWKTYPATGGWDLVQVGSTLCMMGQVVQGNGTVSQELALVNGTNQTLIQYVNLPPGTVHIAADPTNNAVVAEYPDLTVSPPITRFERVYVDTGNTTTLGSTSTLVPGAGFLVTNDGSHIAIFDQGKADFEPNQ